MSEIATAIASAVEEQGAATREIAANVHQAARGTGEIASSIGGGHPGRDRHWCRRGSGAGGAGQLSAQSDNLLRDVDKFLAVVRAA